MKKLMLGMVAAAAMVACADVESSNIVGYGQSDLRFGYSLVTPQFVTVGSTGVALDSLQALGTTANPASDSVSVSVVDEYGTPTATYLWNDWAAATPCWVDEGYAPVDGVTVPAGQAFWTNGSSSEQGIQSAGEVGLNDVSINLRFGYMLTGNPFPVSIALQDIVAGSTDADASASDNVSISKVDEYGTPVATYLWNDWAAAEPCWVDEGYAPVDGVTIAPGEGLWTNGSSEGQFIRFPAPEL